MKARALGEVNATWIQSGAQGIHHGRHEVAQTEQEVVCVNLQLAGTYTGQQGGRTGTSTPGTIAMFDATREFHLDYVEAWTAISFRVPREQLLRQAPALDRTTAVVLDAPRGMVAVVAEFMRSTWSQAGDLDADAAVSIGSAFVSILASALRSTTAEDDSERERTDAALRSAILSHLTLDLAGRTSPASVAGHFEISVRKLHSLFEASDLTFGQTTLRLRVEACARELHSHSKSGSLTDLATRFGFSDLSHMNRAFRAYSGYTPSEYRRLAPTGALPAGERRGAEAEKPAATG